VAPTPLRLRKIEEFLEGSTLGDKTIREAQKIAESSVAPITDIRSTEGYRREIVGAFIKRGLEKAIGGSNT
jgi:carbon-monoxide dehydrogenase medium subunit